MERPDLDFLIRALDQSNDGVLITDADLSTPGPRVVYVNAAYEAISGYSQADMVGRSPRILQGPATDRALLDRLRAALEAGKSFHAEAVNYRKDGSPYWVEWDIAPVRDNAGDVAWFISIQRDVTGRREAEEALARSTRALRDSNDRLRELGGVLSHDLQDPLGVVRGYMDLLRHRHAATLGDDIKYVDAAITGADRMVERIRGLLGDALTLDDEAEAVDLSAVVASVLDDLRPALDAAGAAVAVDSMPMVHGLRHELGEVIHNLVSNAIKYRAPDRPLRIGIAGHRIHDALVQVAVSDNGRGIPADQHDAIFDAGGRGQNHGDVAGTGLGLSFVRRAVDRCGGKIVVHSAPDAGATFLLTLPAPAE